VDYRELHKDALVIDSHNDTIVAHIRRGNASFFSDEGEATQGHSGTISFLRGPQSTRPGAAYLQIDFPKMQQAGIDAAFFAIDVTLARTAIKGKQQSSAKPMISSMQRRRKSLLRSWPSSTPTALSGA